MIIFGTFSKEYVVYFIAVVEEILKIMLIQIFFITEIQIIELNFILFEGFHGFFN